MPGPSPAGRVARAGGRGRGRGPARLGHGGAGKSAAPARSIWVSFEEEYGVESCRMEWIKWVVDYADLSESFPTTVWLQKLASIQPRTSPVKFVCLLTAYYYHRSRRCAWTSGARTGALRIASDPRGGEGGSRQGFTNAFFDTIAPLPGAGRGRKEGDPLLQSWANLA